MLVLVELEVEIVKVVPLVLEDVSVEVSEDVMDEVDVELVSVVVCEVLCVRSGSGDPGTN